MTIEKGIAAFTQLGKFLSQFNPEGEKLDTLDSLNEQFYDSFHKSINQAIIYNGWFNKDFVRTAIEKISSGLNEESLQDWLKDYNVKYSEPKKILVIMAGNIPMVGFHDFISVLLSGNKFVGKCSEQDNRLLPLIAEILIEIESDFKDRIAFVAGRDKDFDAVIATGSDNSARYFNHYFSKNPNIIRKNRTSIAVLDGSETEEELDGLSDDICMYYGLGCRNVSKVYLPKNYNLDKIFNALFKHQNMVENKKYGNNYDYHKAIYLMNLHTIIENGFMILKEDKELHAPVSVVFYEFYDDLTAVNSFINENSEKLQCVVSKIQEINGLPFGQAQSPSWKDYADNVDTIDFLTQID